MRTSAKPLRLGAVTPAAFLGGMLALMAFGFLPDRVELAAWALWLATYFLLCCGVLERPAARVLGGARSPRPGQQALLTPAVRLVEMAGMRADRVLVRSRGSEAPLVEPIGRHTIVVDDRLVQALYSRTLSVAEAAAAVAHASAALRVGPARFDIATRFWALPWTLLAGLCRRVAVALFGVPGGAVAWRLRFIVGGVAVAQSFQGGRSGTGIAIAVLVAVSYLAPAADKVWRAIVERDADTVVAATFLGIPLAVLVQRIYGARSLERVHRIRCAALAPEEVMLAVGSPQLASAGPSDGLS